VEGGHIHPHITERIIEWKGRRSMRAVVVNKYGEAPVVAEVPTPQPGAGQVLIKLTAAGMNPMDRTLATGDWRPMPATFPMVLGADGAGVVGTLGEGAARFSAGDNVFGQLLIAPLASAGTYAQYVAVSEDAPLALVPDRLDLVVAAALPSAGMTALSIVEDVLGALTGKILLIVGAGGGVGSFATQFAVNAGAHVIANVREAAAARMRKYGAAETVDHTLTPLADAVRKTHPDGIDVLLDLASDRDAFAALAALIRPGGTAVTTKFVADTAALESARVTGVNFALHDFDPGSEGRPRVSSQLLDRVAHAVSTGANRGPADRPHLPRRRASCPVGG
jgi:NADPH:quinone reductase-like Zn-dependent oxidoreductase